MRKSFHIQWILIGVLISMALPSSGQRGEVLFTVNSIPAYSDDFEYVYSKNSFNNPDAFTRKDLEEYFELFVNFKLKVEEAKSRGLDTLTNLINEFKSYQVQLKKPYMGDEKLMNSLIQESYERYKTEVNSSHILLRLPPEASPSDTLRVYSKLMEIRERALKGEAFSGLAARYSEDPGGAINGGNLGYFSSGQMVYPFEEASFRTSVGEISMPVRTQFGYHLIKVNDKRPSRGRLEVAHIMIRFNPGMNASDSTKKKNQIFEIAGQLANGFSWDELCRNYSEDASSKDNGGLLRPFRSGNMPPSFYEESFALKNPGDISDPFTTPYGWHIVKLVNVLGNEPLEEIEGTLRSRINSDARAGLKQKALIAKLQSENDIMIDTELYQKIKKQTVENADSRYLKETVMTISEKPFTLEDLIEGQQNGRTIQEVLEEAIIQNEEENLPLKYPEYGHLLNEYWEGILLFQVMEDEIWQRAVQDTIGQAVYFQENRSKYRWKERISGTLYKSAEEDIIEKLNEEIRLTGDTVSNNVLLERYNANSSLALQIVEGPFEKGSSMLPAKTEWNTGYQKGLDNGFYYLLSVKNILPEGPKELKETRGLVISDYQDYLEKIWIRELKAKYDIVVNKKAVKNVYRKLQK